MNHRQMFLNVSMGKVFLNMMSKVETKREKTKRYNYIFKKSLHIKKKSPAAKLKVNWKKIFITVYMSDVEFLSSVSEHAL
jgi:hypothetical protein